MKDVCVIGAGVAGLVAARYLREKFCVTIYEASPSIGGIWLYNKHETGVKHTPMYKNLRTNLPKQLMSFRDLPYHKDIPTFLTHGQVMKYLEDYSKKFSIADLIYFNTPVTSVKPETSTDPVKWIVSTANGSRLFDAVAICTGRYDTPHIPPIKGLETYTGRYEHSKDYSSPEIYEGQHVLIVGAHASGTDLLIDLCEHGVKADISHRRPEPKVGLTPGVFQYAEPVLFEGDVVYFKGDDEGHRFDVIIFATGYDTNLQYLDPDCLIETDVIPRPLYKFAINPKYPTMAIFNQCVFVAPFPFCEYQALYFRQILLEDIKLDCYEERLEEAWNLVKRKPDLHLKYQYGLHLEQFEYNKDLADMCGILLELENDMEALSRLYDSVGNDRGVNPSTYRNKEYEYERESGDYKMIEDWNLLETRI